MVVGISIRAVFNAAASADHLCALNIGIVRKMASVNTQKHLENVIEASLKRLEALVSDKNVQLARRLEQAMRYVADHCTEDLTCTWVAAAVGCSRSHLSTLFSRITRRTSKDMMLSYRMEKAKSMLLQNDKTIADASIAVGYQDPIYWCAVVKLVTGLVSQKSHARSPHVKGAIVMPFPIPSR